MPDPAPQESPKSNPVNNNASTRYERVKQILNMAQGNVNPGYQGYHQFWNLPIAEFLQIAIYGVRMIAPASASPDASQTFAASSCCHNPAPSAPPPPRGRRPGRGAASGLIIGLRGQCPFDGTQFPRLPWDGSAVSPSDIQFISDWIDDGCPATDAPASVSESNVLARARGDAEHPLSDQPINDYRDDAGMVKARKNINALTPVELARFRNAVAQMKSLDNHFQDERSFGYWARIHGNLCQHGWEEFLPWHRPYLFYFEQQLQDIDPSVTLPYWDWTDNVDPNFQNSLFDAAQPEASKTDNGIIPEAYRCFLTQQGWDNLKAGGQVPPDALDSLKKVITVPPPAGNPGDFKTFNSGLRLFFAAGIQYGKNPASDLAIMTELGAINSLWHKLRWPGGDQGLIFEAYPKPQDLDRIMQLTNFFSFGSGPTNDHFFGALENVHNLIHNFSGGANPNYVMNRNPNDRNGEPQFGDMVSAGVTAFDPIFWGHHSNVDRLWWQWQTMHPGLDPDLASSALPPWPVSVGETLNIANFGYEYLKSAQLYPTNNSVPISRFRSAQTKVHPQVLADHHGAEIRLHKVKYTTRGGVQIRVFLNSPGADETTPTRGNDHYVGALHTFTGYCVGGPGHCDPPPETRRKFDSRPRHHKTPGNFRLNATDTVARLAAKGATSFQINLVVLNFDGTVANDALFLDAVSLVFHE